jgi:hypothetical protein
MNILVSQTYSRTTSESAEDGDFSETGFNFENVEYSFRELVKLMQEHPQASSSGPVNERTWFSSYSETIDYGTGEEEETAIHFDRENESRLAKYWAKAWKVATQKSCKECDALLVRAYEMHDAASTPNIPKCCKHK